MVDNVISIQSLTKYYGKTRGIEDLTLEITKGEIFGFLGQNGSGKTTTLRCALNILIQDQGEITINGETVSRDNPEIRDNIGYLPGELFIPANYTIKGFLAYLNSLRKRDAVMLDSLVKRFDIPMNKKIGELSKGNKQKVGIALSFMNDPDIYILDEPSSGLDPIFQQELYDLILEEKARGKTVFFSSHNLSEVQKICDRVAIIREGRLVTLEKVAGLSEKIPRSITAVLTDFDMTRFEQYKDSIKDFDEETGILEIGINNGESLSEILILLASMGLKDLSYPPASLEEYFLAKYKE
jgi:ABC-2 type transport system ATP-binding protein